jgi:hypothetical protein
VLSEAVYKFLLYLLFDKMLHSVIQTQDESRIAPNFSGCIRSFVGVREAGSRSQQRNPSALSPESPSESGIYFVDRRTKSFRIGNSDCSEWRDDILSRHSNSVPA